MVSEWCPGFTIWEVAMAEIRPIPADLRPALHADRERIRVSAIGERLSRKTIMLTTTTFFTLLVPLVQNAE
jgi:hypothetical protein